MPQTTTFDDLDRMDADGWSSHLAPDVVLRLANEDPVYGRAAARDHAAAWLSRMTSISHDILARWRHGDTTIVETSLTVTPTGATEVVIPSVTIYRTEPHGLISDYRVYIDPSPLRAGR